MQPLTSPPPLVRTASPLQVAGDLSSWPSIRMIVIQNSLDLHAGEAGAAHVQAQVLNKGHAGAGALSAGYRHQLTPRDAAEAGIVLSARPVLTAGSSRQFGAYTNGGVALQYSRDGGAQLTLTSGRQLGAHSNAVASWTMGPEAGSAFSLAFVMRRQRVSVSLKLDLGLVTAVGIKVAFALSDGTSLRAQVRPGLCSILCMRRVAACTRSSTQHLAACS